MLESQDLSPKLKETTGGEFRALGFKGFKI